MDITNKIDNYLNEKKEKSFDKEIGE